MEGILRPMKTGDEAATAARSPLIVLGMHRSGTSYLASVIGSLGVDIGSNLLAAAEDNPRGFFEDRDFVDFHASVLTRLLPEQGSGSPLGNILTRTADVIDLTADEMARARMLVAERAEFGFWGWKDPRTCLLLDFWAKQFPLATLVGVYRHPLEVYCSLLKRHQLQALTDETLLIDSWTAYNRALLRCWPRHRGRKVLLGADGVFNRPDALAAMLADRLGLSLPTSLELPEFRREEFRRLPINEGAHAAFAELFPEAAGVFAELQACSDVPIELERGENPFWQELVRRGPSDGAGPALLPVLVALLAPEFGRQRDELVRTGARLAVEEGRNYAALASEHAALRLREEEHARELNEWRVRALVEAVVTGTVFLWGNNVIGRCVREQLGQRGISTEAIIDRAGGDALLPEEFFRRCRLKARRPFVIVCSRSAQTEICAALRGEGFLEGQDFAALPHFEHQTT
jgi:hypothetical protein